MAQIQKHLLRNTNIGSSTYFGKTFQHFQLLNLKFRFFFLIYLAGFIYSRIMSGCIIFPLQILSQNPQKNTLQCHVLFTAPTAWFSGNRRQCALRNIYGIARDLTQQGTESRALWLPYSSHQVPKGCSFLYHALGVLIADHTMGDVPHPILFP